MNLQTLIFDLDDTLIECNRYFKATIDKFTGQMQEWFNALTKEEIREKQLEIDLKSIEQYGLNSSRFPESLAATYKFFCNRYGRQINENEVKKVQNIGQSVFEIKVQPYPYMYDVLTQLSKEGHKLYLYTGGDEENQSRKIAQLELEKYFENRVFIYEHKNADALKEVLDTIQADMKTAWMIGNSLKTDIKPAIEVGIKAIHIPCEIEWSYNKVEDIESIGEFINLASLLELPSFLKENTCYTEV